MGGGKLYVSMWRHGMHGGSAVAGCGMASAHEKAELGGLDSLTD
jgi:hypothetical protein